MILEKSLGSLTIKIISTKTKKNQEPCSKGSMKLHILKKFAKNNPSSLLIGNATIKIMQQMTEYFNQYFTSIGRALKIVLHQKKTLFWLFLGPKA